MGIDVARGMRRLFEAMDSARNGLQTYAAPRWLDRLDSAASDVIGFLFIWARVVVASAVLMWTFFLFVAPLILATSWIIWIISLAQPKGLP